MYSNIIVLNIRVSNYVNYDELLILREAGLQRGTHSRLEVDAARLYIDSLGLNEDTNRLNEDTSRTYVDAIGAGGKQAWPVVDKGGCHCEALHTPIHGSQLPSDGVSSCT